MLTMSRIANYVSSAVARKHFKSLVVWVALACVVVLAFLLMSNRLAHRDLRLSAWSDLGVMLVTLVLALIAAVLFFRLPTGRKHVATRYVLKPVQSADASARYNPQVITMALGRELKRWLTKSYDQSSQATSGGTLTVANISVSLDWLWAAIKQWIIGSRVVVVEAIYFESNDSHRLDVWVKGGKTGYIYTKTVGSISTLIDEAVGSLALELLEELDEVLRGMIYWEFEHFDEAIRLFRRQLPSLERDLDLARLFMVSNREDLALEQVRAVMDDYPLLTWRHRADIRELETEINLRIEEYQAARQSLENLIRRRALRRKRARKVDERRWMRLIGDCYRGEGAYKEAWVQYTKVESLVLEELRCTAKLADCAGLAECLRRSVARPTPALVDLLCEMLAVCESKATCLRMRQSDPTSEYANQLAILKALESSQGSDWRIKMSIAQIHKYMGHAARLDPERAYWHFDKALQAYDEAIRLEEFAPFRNENFSAQVDMAWCECGKLLCNRALRSLTNWSSLPIRIESIIRAVLSLSQCLSPDERPTFVEQWAQAEGETIQCNVALAEAAALMTRAARAKIAPLQRQELLAFLRDSNPGATAEFDVDMIGEIATKYEIGSDPGNAENDDRTLFETVLRLLDVVRKEPSEVIAFLESEIFITDRCIEKFKNLGGSEHHEPEQAYGMACLHAILYSDPAPGADDPIDNVLGFLERAIRLTRSGTTQSHYLGRIRTDHDFDQIREYPKFAEFLEKWSSQERPAKTHSVAT